MAQPIAIKAILPKNRQYLLFNNEELERMLFKAVQDSAQESKRQFEKTVKTWNNKADFEILEDSSDLEAIVGTNDQRWQWIDQGTKKDYPIPQKAGAKTLRFNSKFSPKTKVKKFASVKGSSSPPVAFRKKVIHPGIKARGWSDIEQKRAQKRLTSAVNAVLRKIAKGK